MLSLYKTDSLMEDFFKDFHKDFLSESLSSQFDLKEKEDSYEIDLDLAGFKKEDIKIKQEGDLLSIKAIKKEEKLDENTKYLHKMRSHQSFKESFYLPKNVDHKKIEAKYENGVLSLKIKKTKNFSQKNLIPIS